MINLLANTAGVASYAANKNARFNSKSSHVRTIKQRWDDAYNSLSTIQQKAVNNALNAAVAEFRRRHPNIKCTSILRPLLAKAHPAKMSTIGIDDTMQRQLNIAWVLTLLNTFVTTKVIPIQVYQPDINKDEYMAWDGQHTLVLLWLICTQIFGEKPEDFEIPVNLYSSHQKAEMRRSFIDLNSEEGKKMLDLFDKIEQMIYGVRIDKSTNPIWVLAEQKQQHIESNGLFLTSKKFGDEDRPGAISRMQEINKNTPEVVSWICSYLVAVGAQNRPVEEKEMVMMAFFWERCAKAGIKVTNKFITDVAGVIKNHWGADFSSTSIFWTDVRNSYETWHQQFGNYSNPRVNKEPLHGYPFLVEQLKKDLGKKYTFPRSNTSSEFIPFASTLK